MTWVLDEKNAQPIFQQIINAASKGEKVFIKRSDTSMVSISKVVEPTTQENEQQALKAQREKAAADIKAHRKGSLIGVPCTIDEIIALRDEGRRY